MPGISGSLAIFAAIRRASASLIIDLEFGGMASKPLLLLGKSVVIFSVTQILRRASFSRNDPRQGAAFLSAVAKPYRSVSMNDSCPRSRRLLHGSPHPRSKDFGVGLCPSRDRPENSGARSGLAQQLGQLGIFAAIRRARRRRR